MYYQGLPGMRVCLMSVQQPNQLDIIYIGGIAMAALSEACAR